MNGNIAIIRGVQIGNNDVVEQDKKIKQKVVYITITDIVLGQTQIGVIGSESFSSNKKRIRMYINYYKVTVSDNFGGKTNDYQMTRDAPIMNTDKPNGGNYVKKSRKRVFPFYDPFDWFGPHYEEIEENIKLFNVVNSSFEPVDEFTFNALSMSQYPQGYDAKAFALRNSEGGIQLKAHPVVLPKNKIWNSYRRKDPNYAQEVMIHIGGQLNASGSIMGSVGCFTATEKSKGEEGINIFFNDVRKRAPKDSMIKIKIIGRKNVKWNYKIDENGATY